MLDIDLIRHDPDKVRKAIVDKGEFANVDQVVELDERKRKLLHECEELRSRRNANSKSIAAMKKEGKDASDLVAEMREVGTKVKEYEQELAAVSEELETLLLAIPNCPADDVPIGDTPELNQEVKQWGERRDFDFKPLPHWELGAELGILDFARSSKLSGSGFGLFVGDGAKLGRALISFMLDLHTKEHGYKEVFPPFLVTRECMTGTGQLPKLEEDMYHCFEDDLFLIPTAEVPLTNMHRDEILEEEELPLYYTAYTACFRREAGAYGRDTRGLIRVHQFDKVEMVKFVDPDTSYAELESLLANAERVLQLLGLEYRIMKLCTGDLSFAAAKCYDIELWAPGIERYLEVSSCSNFEDFQARRCSIRYRPKDGKPRFVHTLNGSGVALPRLVIALMETYQTKEGTIELPEVLHPYLGGQTIIGKP